MRRGLTHVFSTMLSSVSSCAKWVGGTSLFIVCCWNISPGWLWRSWFFLSHCSHIGKLIAAKPANIDHTAAFIQPHDYDGMLGDFIAPVLPVDRFYTDQHRQPDSR